MSLHFSFFIALTSTVDSLPGVALRRLEDGVTVILILASYVKLFTNHIVYILTFVFVYQFLQPWVVLCYFIQSYINQVVDMVVFIP